jgi:hypothetical protein
MPHYIQPMREEVEALVGTEGWTKNSIGKMYKIDSFFKETHRFTGIGCSTHAQFQSIFSVGLSHVIPLQCLVSMTRKTVKDFTFNSGVFLPKGTDVCVAMAATHHDEGNYAHPEIFDGFRFAESAVLEGNSSKLQMVRL